MSKDLKQARWGWGSPAEGRARKDEGRREPAGFEDEKGAEVGWALGSKWKKRGDDLKQVLSGKRHCLMWVLTGFCSCCVENK